MTEQDMRSYRYAIRAALDAIHHANLDPVQTGVAVTRLDRALRELTLARSILIRNGR